MGSFKLYKYYFIQTKFEKMSVVLIVIASLGLLAPISAAATNKQRIEAIEEMLQSSGVLLSEGRPTSQSTTRSEGGAASRAVDGSTSGDWYSNSCTHTNQGSVNGEGQWWEVDLQGTARVSYVTIYNRIGVYCLDDCQGRLAGAQVFVGDHLCGEITDVVLQQASYKVSCGGAEGTSVRVVVDQGADTVLTLCEVQVVGWLS